MTRIVPASWMPKVPMKRIIVHWTAGGHKANDTDKRAYHILIEGDGKLVRGIPTIDKNSGSTKPGYAAHTLNCNTDSIGVSLCCMAGAVERPFNAGKFPMTEAQFFQLSIVLADLCETYGIAVTPRTVLSHAEVQGTLGITQRNKWDYTRLAFDPSISGATAIGNRLRADVSGHLKQGAKPVEPIPSGGVAEMVSRADFYSSPTGHKTGHLDPGTRVTIIGNNDAWVRVVSPAGYEGWVKANTLKVLDGPQPEKPTIPDPVRTHIAAIRRELDEIEKSLET